LSGIMSGETFCQVGSQADITLGGVSLALQKIDVFHFGEGTCRYIHLIILPAGALAKAGGAAGVELRLPYFTGPPRHLGKKRGKLLTRSC